jgi:hypothetical protein
MTCILRLAVAQVFPFLERVCPHCYSGEIGDEDHLVVVCLGRSACCSNYSQLFCPTVLPWASSCGGMTLFRSLLRIGCLVGRPIYCDLSICTSWYSQRVHQYLHSNDAEVQYSAVPCFSNFREALETRSQANDIDHLQDTYPFVSHFKTHHCMTM